MFCLPANVHHTVVTGQTLVQFVVGYLDQTEFMREEFCGTCENVGV